MKPKTIFIVVAVLIVLIVGYLMYRKAQDKKIAAAAEADRLLNYNNTYAASNGTTSGATTLESVGSIIDSLAGLFGRRNNSNLINAGSLPPEVIRQFENQCETLYNTPEEVTACVNDKIANYQPV